MRASDQRGPVRGIRVVDEHGADTDGTGDGAVDDGPWIRGARPRTLVVDDDVVGVDDVAGSGQDALSHRPCMRVPREAPRHP